MSYMAKAKAAIEVANALRKTMPKKAAVRPPLFVIPMLIPTYDHVVGIGGIPTKRITVITGPPGTGKTTLGLHILASCQQMGGVGVIYDTEHTITRDQVEFTGGVYDDLLIKPETDEETGEDSPEEYLEAILEDMHDVIVRSSEVNPDVPVTILLDSIDATMSKAEFDGGFEDLFVADRARGWSRNLRKMVKALNKSNTSLILISQERANIGGQGKNKVSGGNAPKFYSSLVLEVRPTGFIKNGEQLIGSEVLMKPSKNKLAMPFQEATARLRWGHGFDILQSTMDRAVELGISSVAGGGWYEIADQNGEVFRRQGIHGKKGLKSFFDERPDALKHIQTQVRDADFQKKEATMDSDPTPPEKKQPKQLKKNKKR